MRETRRKDDLDYEMIVFSDEWFGLPFSCKHLLQHLLPDHPLIWVETIGLRSPKISVYDVRRSIEKIIKWIFSSKRYSPQVIPENLHIIDPIQIPFNNFSIVRNINRGILIKAVNQKEQKIKKMNREKVFITTWPFLGDLLGHLGERLSIYYRVDDFSEFPGVQKKVICELERELVEKVDMVVATSENLTKVNLSKEKVYYLPHGVDFDHFSKMVNARDDLPIQKISSPRIGFFGLLTSWIDFDLIKRVSLDRPKWSFVFIGPSQLPLSALPKAPNIHYLGSIPYEELPRHAKYFDVGIIPFKVNTLTLSVNPLKLMEYLSIGMPVVSTSLPEIMRYREIVAITSGPEDFIKAIQTSLDEDNLELREKRQLIAETHSWEQKSKQFRDWIEEELERKNALSK